MVMRLHFALFALAMLWPWSTAPAITITFTGAPLGETRFRASGGATDLIIPPGSGDIVVGSFSGPDATGDFTSFVPATPLGDTSEIKTLFPGTPGETPSQLVGTIDDDALGSPATNGGLAGAQIYLILSSGGETGIFTSNLAGGSTGGNPWIFPSPWTGFIDDDVFLDAADINRVFDAPGFFGASITAGAGVDDGLTLFSLGAPVTTGVPESGAGIVLLAVVFGGMLFRYSGAGARAVSRR